MDKKKLLTESSIFILGVIVTLGLTSVWNKIFPTEPTIVKELTDSVQVTHNYNFGDSTLTVNQIENQLENLKILNEYEEEVERRLSRINATSNVDSNPIIVEKDFKMKGWVQRNGSNYFVLSCPPNMNAQILDFNLEFIDRTLLDKIATLRVLVYRINSEGKESIYSDTFYEPQMKENTMRMGNGFERGDYQFRIGFILKKDINKEYPEFINLLCKLNK